MSNAQMLELYMRRLQKVAGEMGVGENSKEESIGVDTSNMSKYEKGRFECSKLMMSVREDTKALDDLNSGDSRKKAEVSNRLRRNLRTLKTTSMSMKKDAMHQGKGEEYSDLMRHVRRTETMYKQRFRGTGTLVDDYHDVAPASPAFDLDQDNTKGGYHTFEDTLDQPLIDPTQDEEFQMFYQESAQRNEAINKGLYNVSQSLSRLKQNALETQGVIEAQNQILDNVNIKAENIGRQLKSLNGKLKDTLKDVEKDKYCCYIICFILILGVLGVVLTQTGLLKS